MSTEAPSGGVHRSSSVLRSSGDASHRGSRLTWVLLAGVSSLVGTAVIGLYILATGHPHEDAYILFGYAKNLAGSGVISYFPGGPPAEGATDFLWMLALAGLARLGLDVALAAVLVNSAGGGLMGALLAERLTRSEAPTLHPALATIVAALFVMTSAPAQASYGGFSTLAFSSLALLLLWVQVQPFDSGGWKWVPALGLLLGLVRPDGLIIGVAATLLTFVSAARAGDGALRSYVLACIPPLLLGLAYFSWRLWYFGLLLPLPLYVKGIADPALGWPGMASHIRWLAGCWPWLLFGLLGFFAAPRDRRRDGLALLPFVLLIVALAFTYPAQNHAFRFQAPVTAAMMFLSMDALRWISDRLGSVTAIVLATALFVWSLASVTAEIGHLRRPQYIDTFPAAWAPSLPRDTVLVLTEAGRLAYWSGLVTYDLVGLNTAETALEPATSSYIASLQPDVLMFHEATMLRRGRANEIVAEIAREELVSWIDPERRRALPRLSVTRRAASAALDFLAEYGDDYRIFVVRYGDAPQHIYALRRGRIDGEEFRRLVAVHHAVRRSAYWSVKSSTRDDR